jgi:hypothetical protein
MRACPHGWFAGDLSAARSTWRAGPRHKANSIGVRHSAGILEVMDLGAMVRAQPFAGRLRDLFS